MPMIIPTPVVIADLFNIVSPINVFDPALNPTAAAPRQRFDEVISVVVTNDLNSPAGVATLVATAALAVVTLSGSAAGGELVTVSWTSTLGVPATGTASIMVSKGQPLEDIAIALAAVCVDASTSASAAGVVVTLAPIAPSTGVVATAVVALGAGLAPIWVQEHAEGEWIRGGSKQQHGGKAIDITTGLAYNWVITPVSLV